MALGFRVVRLRVSLCRGLGFREFPKVVGSLRDIRRCTTGKTVISTGYGFKVQVRRATAGFRVQGLGFINC